MTIGEKDELMEFLKSMDRGQVEVGCLGCSQCDGPELVSSKFKDLDGEFLISEHVIDELYKYVTDKVWSDVEETFDLVEKKLND